MFFSYQEMMDDINSLIAFLKEIGVNAEEESYLKEEVHEAKQFYQNYINRNNEKQTIKGRAALAGLHELYRWIWSVKDSLNFKLIHPHLEMLSTSAVKINSAAYYKSPVIDDKNNKLIETIVGMYAVKVGTNVEIDDPVKSSGGANPDVMFDFFGKRVAIACKTIKGRSERTIIDQLKSAKKQIDRSACDLGYLAINAMNVLPHDIVDGKTYCHEMEVLKELSYEILNQCRKARIDAADEIEEIFTGTKMRPVILIFIHTVAKLRDVHGNIFSTSVKATLANDMVIEGVDVSQDVVLLLGVNEFIHNRL